MISQSQDTDGNRLGGLPLVRWHGVAISITCHTIRVESTDSQYYSHIFKVDNMRRYICYLFFFSFLLLSHTQGLGAPKPNILLVVADDMGWTDLGSFGSEIDTPNIDSLADQGVKFTSFYTSISCSPTRSMLLSGTDNHIAGLGNMGELLTEEQKGKPGYEGHLNDRVVSLAEVLRDNGYHTYMAGKWHLGHEPDQYPHARGFDKSLSMLNGGSSYWSDMTGLMEAEAKVTYVENDKKLTELPKDFYSSRNFTDFLIDSIRDDRGDGKPFLAYLAFNAPHDPVHVPEPWLSKYRGQYDEGYEILKDKRAKNAKQRGIFPKDAPSSPIYEQVKAWDSLTDEQRGLEARGMESYAGLVSNMDYHFGRLVSFLKDIGEYENTIIIFLSDNGSNPWYSVDYPGNAESEWFKQFDNSLENIGHPGSNWAYGLGFGSASSGPLDLFKLAFGEGGIRTPMLMWGSGVIGLRQVDAFAYVWDLMPTILDVSGIEHPDTLNGKAVEPMRGKSLVPVLSGTAEAIYDDQEYVCGELGGAGGWARQGFFKAVWNAPPYGDKEWRLFNLEADPGETRNLADEKPEKLEELKNAWDTYSREV